jgi:TolB-like protein
MSAVHPDSVPADAFMPPADDEIRDQLERIRASPAFDAPDRSQKFLCYVVEEALQGRADRIKAYSIALEVFGRNAAFDAQNDPVVRIEAGRVRRALEHYYLLAGQNDPVLVTIPKGGYVPVFTRFNEPAESAIVEPAQHHTHWLKARNRTVVLLSAVLLLGAGVWAMVDGLGLQYYSAKQAGSSAGSVPKLPMVIVAPFEDITGTPSSAIIARGLTDEVISQMARFKEVVVIAADSPTMSTDTSITDSDLPIYGIEGRIRLDQDRLRLSARLVSRTDGTIVWTSAYDAQLDRREIFDIETKLASEIATAIAQPYGVIFKANPSQALETASRDANAYACTSSYYEYRTVLSRKRHSAVQGCLKQVVSEFPNHATAWALLSLTYLDELRFGYAIESSSQARMDLAIEAAEKAVGLDPRNVRALEAEMLTNFFRGDVDNALLIGERAFAINPNDTELAGEYGFRLALSGQWDRGCRLVTDSIKGNPGPTEYFESAMAVCDYMERDYPSAERWARTSNLTGNPIYHLILAAIYGQTERLAQAKVERQWLEANAPEYLRDLRGEVSKRILRPEDRDHFIDGLRKAGLHISAQHAPRSEAGAAEVLTSQN